MPSGTAGHLVCEALAYAIGFALFRRLRRTDDPLASADRWSLVAAAVVGAAVGSKLLHHLVHPTRWGELALHPAELLAGKTIVGGLLGGWLAVELVKRRIGVRMRTGDLYVLPLICGIAIGRVGCFLAGLADDTYGVPTTLPWGVDFGDGIARHPTQLYEIAFLLMLGLLLAPQAMRVARGRPVAPPGALFRAFALSYLGFRLLVDFLKPYERIAGLNALQWACLAALVVCLRDLPEVVRTLSLVPRGGMRELAEAS